MKDGLNNLPLPPNGAQINQGLSFIGGNKMSDITQKVKDIIVEQLGVNPEEVTEDASFIDDLGADSLDTVELVMALEEGFDIEVPDEEAEKLTTVGAAIKYIEENSK